MVQRKIIRRKGPSYVGMKDGEIITLCKQMKLTDIILSDKYQVVLIKKHVNELAASMEEYGYDKSKTVTVNQDRVLIGGYHRFHAAKQNGEKYIWVTVKYYSSPEAEARAHRIDNGLQRSPKTLEVLWNLRCENNPFAVALYSLYYDDKSLLHRRIKLAKTDLPYDTLCGNTASRMIQAITAAAFGISMQWKPESIAYLNKRYEELGYELFRQRINDFFSIYYEAYPNREQFPTAYDDKFFRGLTTFYMLLRGGEPTKGDRLAKKSKPNEIDPRKRLSLVKSLRNFPFSSDDTGGHNSGKHSVMVIKIAAHYNLRRTLPEERVSYSVS